MVSRLLASVGSRYSELSAAQLYSFCRLALTAQLYKILRLLLSAHHCLSKYNSTGSCITLCPKGTLLPQSVLSHQEVLHTKRYTVSTPKGTLSAHQKVHCQHTKRYSVSTPRGTLSAHQEVLFQHTKRYCVTPLLS